MHDRDTAPRPLHEIAQEIDSAWAKVTIPARPYLDALHALSTTGDTYGAEDGADMVRRFLINATAFRGEDARRLKAELRRHLPNGR